MLEQWLAKDGLFYTAFFTSSWAVNVTATWADLILLLLAFSIAWHAENENHTLFHQEKKMPCSGAVSSVCFLHRDSVTYCSELFPLPGAAVAFIKRCLQYHSPFIITVDLIEMMHPSFSQYHVIMACSVQLFSLMQTGSLGIKNAFQLKACVTSNLIFSQRVHTYLPTSSL